MSGHRSSSRSVVEVEDPCPTCRRAGHFDSLNPATQFWYPAPPTEAPDFGVTWEFFGSWRVPGSLKKGVGGKQLIIVSQRARRVLTREKIHGLDFVPVWFERNALS